MARQQEGRTDSAGKISVTATVAGIGTDHVSPIIPIAPSNSVKVSGAVLVRASRSVCMPMLESINFSTFPVQIGACADHDGRDVCVGLLKATYRFGASGTVSRGNRRRARTHPRSRRALGSPR